MDENAETPELDERQWLSRVYARQCELAALVARVVVCLERAPWMVAVQGELPASKESGSTELPGTEESLPTWILTDERVAHLERMVEQEQRVRGQAYGG